MAKVVILTMLAFAAVLILGGGAISMLIGNIAGGGVAESYIYPIYGGIILLAGFTAGCTCLIFDRIKELEKKLLDEKKTSE